MVRKMPRPLPAPASIERTWCQGPGSIIFRRFCPRLAAIRALVIFFTSSLTGAFIPDIHLHYGNRDHTPPRRDQGHSASRDRGGRPARTGRRGSGHGARGEGRHRAYLWSEEGDGG